MIIPDENNLRSLRAFFQTYPLLRSSELAQLAGVSLRKIQDWRKKCGLSSKGHGWGGNNTKRPFERKPQQPLQVDFIPDSAIWDNREWFEEQYRKGYGRKIISRMTGRSSTLVVTKMRRYNIKPQQKSCSKNPNCNKKWLEENYEILGLSLEKCGALANVSAYTIYHWLVKFNIRIRDRHECNAGRRYGKPQRTA